MKNVGIYWKFISEAKTLGQKLQENVAQTLVGCREGPTVPGICKFIAKVRETDLVVNALRRECTRTVRHPKISKLRLGV